MASLVLASAPGSTGSATATGPGFTEPFQLPVQPPVPPVIGAPAAPGQPLNAPILNNLQIVTGNPPVSDDQYGTKAFIGVQNVTFQLPVHDQTVITAYLGKRDMTLEPDGTVTNSLAHDTRRPIQNQQTGFRFLTQADRKLKVIVVARNEFGVSSREVNTTHLRACAGVPVAPATIGNCNDFCLQSRMIGGNVEFKARFRQQTQTTYLWLDVAGTSPYSDWGTSPFEYTERFEPVDPGEYEVVSLATPPDDQNYICMNVRSWLNADPSVTRMMYGKMRTE